MSLRNGFRIASLKHGLSSCLAVSIVDFRKEEEINLSSGFEDTINSQIRSSVSAETLIV